MASLEESAYSILTGHAGLSALVGTRVEPAPRSQAGALPSISYSRVSTLPVHTHSGAVGLRRARLQFDVWGATALSAQAVAQELVTALDHYRGTVGGVRIDAALQANDLMENDAEDATFRRILDFQIWSNS